MKKKKVIAELIIFILILIWVFTFATKMFDFETFAGQINGAYLLSGFKPVLPYALQVIHLLLIILLINKNWRKLGLFTSLSLLILYSGYLVYILKFAPSIPCSCIALFNWMNWNDQLYFNFIILAINIIGLVMFSLKQPPHSKHIQTTLN